MKSIISYYKKKKIWKKNQPRRVNFLADPAAYQEQTGLKNPKTRHEFEMALNDLTLYG